MKATILTAFHPEFESVKAMMTDFRDDKGTGYIGNISVYLGNTGIGTTEAAMATQSVISEYRPDCIVMVGIAGGLHGNIGVGDVFIPGHWGNCFSGAMVNPSEEGGYQLPDFLEDGGYGNHKGMFPFIRLRNSETPFWHAVDQSLLNTASEIDSTNEELGGSKITCRGYGLSSSMFMDNRKFREFLYGVFKADVIDMETSAVCRVCEKNKVPFIAIRAVSDIVGEHSMNQLENGMEKALKNATTALTSLLGAL